MNKRNFAIFIVAILLLSSFPASALKYTYPAPPIDGGRVAQSMPEDFAPENTAGYKLLAKESFDNNQVSSKLTATTAADGTEISFTDNTVKLVKSDTSKSLSFVMCYDDEIAIGDFYLLRCKIKTEDIQDAAPKCILQANGTDANGKTTYLKEEGVYGKFQNIRGSNDWYVMTQLLQIPEGTTKLSLYAYLSQKTKGTAYFDDFELFHVAIDPLQTILKRPNYKGLIYGNEDAEVVLDVVIDESEGFFSYDDMSLKVQLVDKNNKIYKYADADTVVNKMNFVFSLKDFPEGEYYLQSYLYKNSSGELISNEEHTIRKCSDSYRPQFYLSDSGRVMDGGNKKLLTRIYNSGGDYVEVAEAAKESSIESIAHYGLWWATADNENGTHFDGKQYMRENNIKAHISLEDFVYSQRKFEEGKTLIRKREDMLPFFHQVAQDYKNDEILDGYYLFDEPNPYKDGEELCWANEIMAQADIDHPTYGVADRFWDKYGIYTKMTDILCIDPYPIKGEEDDDIALVGRSVREAKMNFPNRPVCITLQGFRWVERGDKREPTRQELLNMAWQAICEGADGIEWYSYSSMKSGSQLEDSTKTMDEWRDDMKSVFTDVMSYEDIILSDEPAPRYSVSGGGDWLNITLRRYNEKTYLFAVNNTKSQRNAIVNIEGVQTQSLSFEPLEVVVREFDNENYLSPEAEIEYIGFNDGEQSFAVSEGEENILYIPRDAGVIYYSAKVSDNAKMYIGSKEVPENGKITVRLAKQFTVGVVSEDGKTETIKKYRVVKE